MLDGGVFRGQAKSVEADGMQHVETAHAGLARHSVADGVIACMPHVQVARRIREHLENVLLGLGRIGVHGKEIALLPCLHPFPLNGPGVIRRDLTRHAALVVMLAAIAHGRLLAIDGIKSVMFVSVPADGENT